MRKPLLMNDRTELKKGVAARGFMYPSGGHREAF